MRFKTTPKPEHYETRILKKFLFIPMHLDNEWRWLEYASIDQVYYRFKRTSGWYSKNWNNQ